MPYWDTENRSELDQAKHDAHKDTALNWNEAHRAIVEEEGNPPPEGDSWTEMLAWAKANTDRRIYRADTPDEVKEALEDGKEALQNILVRAGRRDG